MIRMIQIENDDLILYKESLQNAYNENQNELNRILSENKELNEVIENLRLENTQIKSEH